MCSKHRPTDHRTSMVLKPAVPNQFFDGFKRTRHPLTNRIIKTLLTVSFHGTFYLGDALFAFLLIVCRSFFNETDIWCLLLRFSILLCTECDRNIYFYSR